MTGSEQSSDASLEPIRAFLALEIPPDNRKALATVAGNFPGHDASVRWTPDPSIHLTVKFLGETPAHVLECLRGDLDRTLRGFAPFSLTIRGLGAFPSARNPQILWAGIESDSFMRLFQKVEAATGLHSISRETRAPHPHVTIGRIRRRVRDLEAWISSYRDRHFGCFEVGQLTAFRSDLRQTGAVHHELWSVPFTE